MMKTDALVRPVRPGLNVRTKARDVYDTAFILKHRPNVLTTERLEEIETRLGQYRNGATRAEWESAFTSDVVMRRVRCDEVWTALERALRAALETRRIKGRTERGEWTSEVERVRARRKRQRTMTKERQAAEPAAQDGIPPKDKVTAPGRSGPEM